MVSFRKAGAQKNRNQGTAQGSEWNPGEYHLFPETTHSCFYYQTDNQSVSNR